MRVSGTSPFAAAAILMTCSIIAHAQVEFGSAGGFGGEGVVVGTTIVVDGSGSVYALGRFRGGIDFNPSNAVYEINSINSQTAELNDAYITKLNANGSFAWAKSFGGDQASVSPLAMKRDSAGNLIIVGYFTGPVDFNPDLFDVYELNCSGQDVFILKLDSAGRFVWVKQFVGNGLAFASGLAIDAADGIVVCGAFSGEVDFDPGQNFFVHTATFSNVFYAKLNKSGNFLYAKHLVCGDVAAANDLALDSSGRLFVTGFFQDTCDFNPGNASANRTADARDGFVAAYEANGDFRWVQVLEGVGNSEGAGQSIALRSDGEMWVAGGFEGTFDLDPGPESFQITVLEKSAFLGRLDAVGALITGLVLTGDGAVTARAIVLDSHRNVFLTGGFRGPIDFDPSTSPFVVTADTDDCFVLRLDADGLFGWVAQQGGEDEDISSAIVCGANGAVHTTGNYRGVADFDPGAAVVSLLPGGTENAFVSLLNDVTPVFGDVNDDGGVTAQDVQLVINGALGLRVTVDPDLNGDSDVDAVDVQLVINAALDL